MACSKVCSSDGASRVAGLGCSLSLLCYDQSRVATVLLLFACNLSLLAGGFVLGIEPIPTPPFFLRPDHLGRMGRTDPKSYPSDLERRKQDFPGFPLIARRDFFARQIQGVVFGDEGDYVFFLPQMLGLGQPFFVAGVAHSQPVMGLEGMDANIVLPPPLPSHSDKLRAIS